MVALVAKIFVYWILAGIGVALTLEWARQRAERKALEERANAFLAKYKMPDQE